MDEKKIWKYLRAHGLTEAGAAGMMGNLRAESGCRSNRVENLLLTRYKEKGIRYADATYTADVDSGKLSLSQFLRPFGGSSQYGYGIAQWTSPGRKQGLYNYARAKGASIGDLNMQLEYLVHELQTVYKPVWYMLTTSASVNSCSDAVLMQFEMPDKPEEKMITRRGYSWEFYNQFAEGVSDTATASEVVRQAKAWVGLNEADGSHKKIIDIYNSQKPLPRGYKMSYTDAWCAAFVSAVAIQTDATAIIPPECGCPDMISLFQKLGEWQESDAVTPQAGWIIFYDWQDSGTGDNQGVADHVGIVEKVADGKITVIEGNYNDAVGRRQLKVNGAYIRGYGIPKYSKDDPICGTCTVALKEMKKGARDIQLKTVQLKLKYLGYRGKDGKVLKIDGDFGANTLYALKAYQKAKRLKEDGVIGPETWTAILN